jgi:hypothetical protein
MAPLVPPLWVAAPLWGECWVGYCLAVSSLVEACPVGACPGAGAPAFRAAVGPLEGQEST